MNFKEQMEVQYRSLTPMGNNFLFELWKKEGKKRTNTSIRIPKNRPCRSDWILKNRSDFEFFKKEEFTL